MFRFHSYREFLEFYQSLIRARLREAPHSLAVIERTMFLRDFAAHLWPSYALITAGPKATDEDMREALQLCADLDDYAPPRAKRAKRAKREPSWEKAEPERVKDVAA